MSNYYLRFQVNKCYWRSFFFFFCAISQSLNRTWSERVPKTGQVHVLSLQYISCEKEKFIFLYLFSGIRVKLLHLHYTPQKYVKECYTILVISKIPHSTEYS